jgi:hypothetical protein
MVIAKAEKYAHVVVRAEAVESVGLARAVEPANQDEDEVNQHGTTE